MNAEAQIRDARGEWQPPSLPVPGPLFYGPWKPLVILKHLWNLIWPYNLIYAAVAFLSWLYLTPSLETTARFGFGWIALLYLRNAALLTLIAGGLHLWLYVRRTQGTVSSTRISGWPPGIPSSRSAARPSIIFSGAWSAGAPSGPASRP